MEKSKELQAMVSSIMDGNATVEELGVAVKALQTKMSVALISGVDSVLKSLNESTKVLDTAVSKFNEKIKIDVETDLLETKELLEIIERMQNQQLKVLDLQRKIVQGKELIPQPSLSDEEKQVITLLKSFSSQEDKVKFLNVVKDTLKKDNDNSFDE